MLKRLTRDMTMADAARTPGGARVDLAFVADMVAPGARVLAATASCCDCSPKVAGSTAAVSSSRARA
jgi:hypothetical protein